MDLTATCAPYHYERCPPTQFNDRVSRWRSYAKKYGAGIPENFQLQWICLESDGDVTSYEPDGSESARGLFQVYSTGERQRLGLDTAGFERLSTDGDWSYSQGVRLVRFYMSDARKQLATWGVAWPTRDFWKLVKLHHGLPAVITTFGNKVKQLTGHYPHNWNELITIGLGNMSGLSSGMQSLAKHAVCNAEAAGNAVSVPRLGIMAAVAAVTFIILM